VDPATHPLGAVVMDGTRPRRTTHDGHAGMLGPSLFLLDREPGIIDWVEDLVFTGSLFVAATLPLYQARGSERRR
jgi:hypothetical protein